MAHLAVTYAPRLEDARARPEHVLSRAFAREHNPSFQDPDHLKIEIVRAPHRRALHPRRTANDMRVIGALRGGINAELAVLKERAKAGAREFAAIGVGDGEGPVSSQSAQNLPPPVIVVRSRIA